MNAIARAGTGPAGGPDEARGILRSGSAGICSRPGMRKRRRRSKPADISRRSSWNPWGSRDMPPRQSTEPGICAGTSSSGGTCRTFPCRRSTSASGAAFSPTTAPAFIRGSSTGPSVSPVPAVPNRCSGALRRSWWQRPSSPHRSFRSPTGNAASICPSELLWARPGSGASPAGPLDLARTCAHC